MVKGAEGTASWGVTLTRKHKHVLFIFMSKIYTVGVSLDKKGLMSENSDELKVCLHLFGCVISLYAIDENLSMF